MDALDQSRDIFRQLAAIEPQAGLQTLIENHDAWVHNGAILQQVSAAMRAQLARTPRPEPLARRIARQQQALAALVTRLPRRHLSAG